MQSSIEGYLRLFACEHLLSANATAATVAVAFFVTTANHYRYQLVYIKQPGQTRTAHRTSLP